MEYEFKFQHTLLRHYSLGFNILFKIYLREDRIFHSHNCLNYAHFRDFTLMGFYLVMKEGRYLETCARNIGFLIHHRLISFKETSFTCNRIESLSRDVTQ